MSGIKGKSGLGKGYTNNPYGRPVGSKNRVSSELRQRIAEYLETDFDNFIEELKRLDFKDRVRVKLTLIKMVVPRPVAEKESDEPYQPYRGLERFFGDQYRDHKN